MKILLRYFNRICEVFRLVIEGTQQDVYSCTTCGCPLTLRSTPTPVGGIVGYYNCENGCDLPAYVTQVAVFAGVPIMKCNICQANCSSCPDGNSCSNCNIGYYPNPTPNICPACSVLWGIGCGSCNSSTCFSCKNDWVQNGSLTLNTYDGCAYCLIIPNCATCYIGPICATCKINAVLNLTSRIFVLILALIEKQCIVCQVFVPGCGTCIDGPACIACATGYVFNLRVDNYYILNATQKPCFACSLIPNCSLCDDGPVCNTCFPHHHFNLTSSNFYLIQALPEKHCVPCSLIPNCSVCIDGPICVSCMAAHHFNTSYSTFKFNSKFYPKNNVYLAH